MADQETDEGDVRPTIPVLEDFEPIANILLKHQMHLSALELHTELVEYGVEIPKLRDFFSNPGNFERQFPVRAPSPGSIPRTSSINTIDSLDDFARFSDDGGRDNTDERIAVLEFELRKAQDTIRALRGSLTEVAGSDCASPSRKGLGSSDVKETSPSDDSIKPHEIRAINFLVNEYLLINGYRLTSITFSDENADQDFDDWDDVGLNIPKPPNVLHLYRDYSHHTVPEVMLVLQAVREEKNKLDEEVVRLQAECKSMKEEIGELKFENDALTNNINKIQSDYQHFTSPGNTSLSTIKSELSENKTLSPHQSINDTVDEEANVESNDVVDNEIPDKVEQFDEETTSEDIVVDERTELNSDETEKDDVTNKESETSLKSEAPSDSIVASDIVKTTTTCTSSSETQTQRMTSTAFREALLSSSHIMLDNRLASEVSKLSDTSDDLVLILARCLPHIVPNVLLNKREELIPVILCTSIHHPDIKERDGLMHMLFNLIKRPDEEQRQMIMNGCAAFAQVIEASRVEAELLPQLWEQITHKYHERRLLVAEACGSLSPYLPVTIRSSLVWSMIKQMLADDRNEEVREAVTKSLGLVLADMTAGDKYEQAHELLMLTLSDAAERVSQASQSVLLPSLADWAMDLDKLDSHLAPSILNKIECALDDFAEILETPVSPENEDQVNRTMDFIRTQICRFLDVFTSIIPALFANVLRKANFAKKHEDVQKYDIEVEFDRFLPATSPLMDMEVIIGSSQLLAFLVRRFDKHVTSEEFKSWDSLLWIQSKCIPKLCDIAGRIHSSLIDCLQKLMVLFRTLCVTFGQPYSHNRIKPCCIDRLDTVKDCREEEDDIKRDNILSSASIPVLAVGVFGSFDEEDDKIQLAVILRESIIALAQHSLPLHGPILIYQELSAYSTYHQLLIGVLWEIVVYQDPAIRCSTGELFMVLIKGVDVDTISRHVIPALVTLASDSHMSVRTASIPAFGSILENVTDKVILDKVYMQFKSFIEDPQYKNQQEIQLTLIRTFGKVGPHSEPLFRDKVILPRLAAMAYTNNHSENDVLRKEIAVELLEAYVSLTCCFIVVDVLNEHVIPGLRSVQEDIYAVAPYYEETISVLLRECEAKLEEKTYLNLPATAQSHLGRDLKNTFMSGFNKLMDASNKPKMSDIFKRKERTDSMKSM